MSIHDDYRRARECQARAIVLTVVLAALVGLGLLFAYNAQAQESVERWTPRTQLWLARAFIAEAGWDAERDHAAIAWVLSRRAEQRGVDLVSMIRAYCAGLGGSRVGTPRQAWLHGLGLAGARPPRWPSKASWRSYRERWREALTRAATWARGELPDPCRGLAMHWGGPMDSPSGRMVRVNCGDTRNAFYRVRK